MTKTKICGLSRMEDILGVNQLLPDYIGFVFCKTSKRYVEPSHALQLKKLLDRRISSVGVFVNESPETIEKIAQSATIDLIQLHGNEREAYIRELKQKTQLPIIKAFQVNSCQDIEAALQTEADFILFDHGQGGTGKTFDWSLIHHVDRPFFLAGGLNCTNIIPAIAEVSPYAVDTSSGVETAGCKDMEKIREFILQVRNYNAKISTT